METPDGQEKALLNMGYPLHFGLNVTGVFSFSVVPLALLIFFGTLLGVCL